MSGRIKNILENLKRINESERIEVKSSSFGQDRVLFKNPNEDDIEEIMDITNNIRFIALKDEEVYVTSDDVFEEDIIKEIPDISSVRMLGFTFAGEGRIKSNQIEVTGFSDKYIENNQKRKLYNVAQSILEGEYEWLSNYNFILDSVIREAERTVDWLEDEM